MKVGNERGEKRRKKRKQIRKRKREEKEIAGPPDKKRNKEKSEPMVPNLYYANGQNERFLLHRRMDELD